MYIQHTYIYTSHRYIQPIYLNIPNYVIHTQVTIECVFMLDIHASS